MLQLPSRADPAHSISKLTHFLLHGSNTLSETERELIATVVADDDHCLFCLPVSKKMEALLAIAVAVRHDGKQDTQLLIDQAIRAGATEVEINDTVLMAVLLA